MENGNYILFYNTLPDLHFQLPTVKENFYLVTFETFIPPSKRSSRIDSVVNKPERKLIHM